MMDQIEEYHDSHKLFEMNQWLYEDEEYDTDALEDDLEDLKQSNYIRKLESIKPDSNGQSISDFESFYTKYKNKDYIVYIQELFNFMVQDLRKKMYDKFEYIHMIQSEYEGLPQELKTELERLFDPSFDVQYINEYEWVIEGEEFKKLKN